MRSIGRLGFLFLFLCTVLGAVAPRLQAQTFRGGITGTVTDSGGAVLPGADVAARNINTGLERYVLSAANGEFSITELPIGTYRVTVTHEGFDTFVATGLDVSVANQLTVIAALKTGSSKETVTVTADAIQVETSGDTLGGTLSAQEIRNLPVNGRDYTKLIYLNPGVTGSPDQISDSPGSYGPFSMNGARGRSNNFLLDGTDENDGYRNDPALNEPGVFGDPATILPVDAVQELRVLSNYEAEYGRNAGAIINIVTTSGTNAFHGSAIEYFRNNALDARNYFNSAGTVPTTANPDATGTPQAPFHNNQFGGSLGGPIVKDKTFFFFDYEGQRESVGTVSIATVPTAAQLAGVTNPVITALLARDPWPTPIGNSNTAVSIAPSYNNLTSLIGKIDHNFNANNQLSGRYFFGDSKQSFPLALTASGGELPGFNTFTPTRVQLVSLSYVTVISPTKVNEARMGWNRFAEGFFPQDQSFAPSSIGLNTGTGAADMGLPVISVSGFAQLGANKTDPRQRYDSNWQGFDNFSWNTGANSFKFGYEFRRTSITQFIGTNFRGKLSFDSLADFLSGTVDGGSQASGDSRRHSYQNSHGVYAQDTWRITPKLTANLGLRYDYYGIFHEKNDLLSNITAADPVAATVTLTQVGQPGLGQLYQPDYKNIAPRVSLAWDPMGKGETVIRAGWGLFFDAFSQDVFLGHVPYNSGFDPGPAYNPFGPAPIYSEGAVGGTIVAGAPLFNAAGGTPAGDIFSVDRNIRTPYMMNFNFNMQQQLTKSVVAQIGYVGSLGHHLLRFRDINQPSQATIDAADIAYAQSIPGCYPGGGPGCIPSYYGADRVYANNPYGAYYINQEESTANSNYNSLQASLRMVGYHGFTNIVNYTWSHSLDNASDSEDFVPNASQPNDSTNPAGEYGDSNFDVRNRVTWIFGYEFTGHGGRMAKLKEGWGVDSTVTYQTGQPYNLNYNFEDDYSGSGEGFDRPDVVGPVRTSNNPFNFLDLSSFAIPCSLTQAAITGGITGTASDCIPGTRHFGNLGRNSLRALSYKNWDFALSKKMKIRETSLLELRAEFFNLPNHPNFANPLLPNFIADAAQQGFAGPVNGREVGAGAYHLQATGDVGIGNPFLGGGAPRGIQLAAIFRF